jgi:hypothetical protein
MYARFDSIVYLTIIHVDMSLQYYALNNAALCVVIDDREAVLVMCS